MGRRNSKHYTEPRYADLTEKRNEPWKRERRPTRDQRPPPTLKVDVHGILFATLAIIFVVYPLVQWALGR